MDAAIKEIEFLARSPHRVGVLYALTDRSHRRDELQERTGASSANLGRVLRGFEERHWIVRDGCWYEATSLGELVTGEFKGLHEAMKTERKLRDVWQWLPTEVIGLDVKLFADAVVTVPEFGSPHRIADRFVELVAEAETLRGFTTTTVKSDMAAVFRNAIDGMEVELLWPPDLTEAILTSHPELAPEAIESGNLTVLTNDDLPAACACAIFDERVALGGFDRETGMLRAGIDTDAPAARGRAQSMYESYRREARPLTPEMIVE